MGVSFAVENLTEDLIYFEQDCTNSRNVCSHRYCYSLNNIFTFIFLDKFIYLFIYLFF